MLHGVNPDIPFGKGRGASRVTDVFKARFDFRPAIEIDPAKANPTVGRGRQKTHAHLVAAEALDLAVAKRSTRNRQGRKRGPVFGIGGKLKRNDGGLDGDADALEKIAYG